MMERKKAKRLQAALLMAALAMGACSTSPDNDRSSRGPNYDKAYDDYLALGARYLQMGRFDLAEPKLKRAIEINSQNPEAWNVLAVLYEEKRDIANGYQVYEKLVSSHPDYTLGFMNFATFLCKFDREPERQNLYGRMRAKGGEFVTLSYIAEGNCEREKRRINAAESAYRQALATNSQAAGALLPLAQIAIDKQDYASALRYLKVVHTYVGYSADSAYLGILAARATGDSRLEEELIRVMRGNYNDSPLAKQLGL